MPGFALLAVVAAGAIATMVWWELRTRTPVLELRVFRHRSLTAATVSASADPVTQTQLAGMTRYVRATSPDDLTAAGRALAALGRRVQAQAQMLAYRDAFGFPGVVVLGSLPLVLLLRRPAAAAAPPSDLH